MKQKFFSFSGQTTLSPIFLTPCGHVVSIVDAIRKNEEISTSFNFFLFENTFSASFLFKNLTIALSVFPSLLQGTILHFSRLTMISCKTRSTKFSRSFSATEQGMPEKSKHPLLEYCSYLWCCLSSSMSLLSVVLNASCKTFEVFSATVTWLVNSSFFFTSESILDVISKNFFDMPLFCWNKQFCSRIVLSCNAKKNTYFFQLPSNENLLCHDKLKVAYAKSILPFSLMVNFVAFRHALKIFIS